jgi:hypothetical protein
MKISSDNPSILGREIQKISEKDSGDSYRLRKVEEMIQS